VIAVYRTVFFDAATILAGIIPGDILALMRERMYDRYRMLDAGTELMARARSTICDQEKVRALSGWLFSKSASRMRRDIGSAMP